MDKITNTANAGEESMDKIREDLFKPIAIKVSENCSTLQFYKVHPCC